MTDDVSNMLVNIEVNGGSVLPQSMQNAENRHSWSSALYHLAQAKPLKRSSEPNVPYH